MKYYGLLIFILLISSCGGEKREKEPTEESVEAQLRSEDNEVTVTTLKYSDFKHELISNGKLSAKRMADLRFEAAEPIARIYVKNGQRVAKVSGSLNSTCSV